MFFGGTFRVTHTRRLTTHKQTNKQNARHIELHVTAKNVKFNGVIIYGQHSAAFGDKA